MKTLPIFGGYIIERGRSVTRVGHRGHVPGKKITGAQKDRVGCLFPTCSLIHPAQGPDEKQLRGKKRWQWGLQSQHGKAEDLWQRGAFFLAQATHCPFYTSKERRSTVKELKHETKGQGGGGGL